MKIFFLVILGIFITGCLREEPLNLEFTGFEPVLRDDGIQISNPEQEQMDANALEDVFKETYENDDFWSIRSLLVFRNNKLVAETYHKDPEDIDAEHLIWSSTKQVVGIMVGLALEHGYIDDINDPIGKYLGYVDTDYPDKKEITIRHLLTMHSGIDFSNDGISGQTDKILRQQPEDIMRFILSLPMREPPGTHPHYNDGDPQLIAGILQHQLGKPLDSWAKEELFSKIGVTSLTWNRYTDGTTLGGFGIETNPRELSKIALLVQNRGIAGNDTLLSPEWIEEMVAAHVPDLYGYSFGYQWWSDSSSGVHFMAGHGGQFAIIHPEKALLIVFTAIPNTQGSYQIELDEAMYLVRKIIYTCI